MLGGTEERSRDLYLDLYSSLSSLRICLLMQRIISRIHIKEYELLVAEQRAPTFSNFEF